MITPKDFITLWGADDLRAYPAKAVDRLPIAAEDKAFLTQAGLPSDAPPFLSFEVPASGALPTVAEQWGVGDELSRYRLIGTDGVGNPIALDETRQGEVVYLDHERDFTRLMMNTTVRQMAASLLAYRKLVADSQAAFGPDAFLDGKIPTSAREELRRTLTTVDPAAMKPGTFWHSQLEMLDSNAG